MIVFVTTAHHGNTVAALVEARYGVALPPIRQMNWDQLWRTDLLPRATYILTDFERLMPLERMLAAQRYGALRDAGQRVLNDPARVPSRHALLLRLQAAGINPFRSWRAEEAPRPARFPVFLRHEGDHGQPIGELLPDQAALDAAIAALATYGIPLDGVLAIEFCSEPMAPGVWRKWGTFRIGEQFSTDHHVTEGRWCVKYGDIAVVTEASTADEHAVVQANAYAEALAPAFRVADIEWGRADHAVVDGRQVVYEINTNPYLGGPTPQRFPLRDATLALSRARLAAGLWAIDTPGEGVVELTPDRRMSDWRHHSFARFMAWRP